MRETPRHLDGNVMAGALSTVFAFEVTAARCTCASCGATAVLAEHHVTLTRQPPDGWTGHTGRIDAALLAASGVTSGTAFVCGYHAFVDAASDLLLDVGFDATAVRTERFGPTG
jgi:ferredoxin-NADP reductase